MEKKSLVLDELNSSQKRSEKDLEIPSPIQDVVKLLEYDEAVDRQMLKDLGMDAQIKLAADIKGRKMELENFSNKFKGKVFHISAVKALAENYRLRFLPSTMYCGQVDVSIPQKIREFAEMSGDEMLLNPGVLNTRFFILAPPESFKLEKSEVYKDPSKLQKFLKAMASDPVLFYKIDENHVRMIHKWGKDFSVFRAIKGWRWKSEWNFTIFGAIISLFVSSVFFSLILSPTAAPFWFYGAIILGTGVGTLFNWMSNSKNSSFIKENLSSHCWNTRYLYY